MKNIKTIVLMCLVLGCAAAIADARPRLFRPLRPRGGCAGGSCSVSASVQCADGVCVVEAKPSDAGNVWHPLALARARACADRMAVGHFLGCPDGCYEGAGSGSTEDQAIRNCCFWGQRRPRAIATVRRGFTWFAVVLYE